MKDMQSFSDERIHWIFQNARFWERKLINEKNKDNIKIASAMIEEYEDIIDNVLDIKDQYKEWKEENPNW